MTTTKPLVLVVIDGWALNEVGDGNAVVAAEKPYYDALINKFPTTEIKASGLEVGLPQGQMGNSEVGHLNMGAGRVVYQDLTRINKAIEEGSFFKNEKLAASMDNCIEKNSTLHLMGLLSDGGVHSHTNHLFALLDMAKEKGVQKVKVHPILDGRDVPPKSALGYIEMLEAKLKDVHLGEIATVSGRYYTMDRDKRWERTEKAYNTIVAGNGDVATSALEAVESAYEQDKTDEFVPPVAIAKESKVEDGDSVIFYNFRPDRARQITTALTSDEFDGFNRKHLPKVHYTCFTQYDENFSLPIAFEQKEIVNTLGEVLSKAGKKQLRITETEKYAHITFFFNGGVEKSNDGEQRVLIPSPKVATYDLQPEMSAHETTDRLLEEMEQNDYDFILINYANPDMVGHTGNFKAAVKACNTVDKCLSKLVPAILKKGGGVIVTSDHGNAEQMVDPRTKKPHTAHTSNPVPLTLAGFGDKSLKEGALCDIAPTVLELMGVEIPAEMTGESLVKK
ncbi:2,3-bisphosphoglycerate-independent phosphoglycerate mutase [Proteinivorax hydrogeniformans]|uniref:2,3-bisphosphoglycerate-independent phosphoglycerate mutase n=1 Tax=Proteinivorax hydrogeniformans TaxID=1826727 RepID=A0AAU8HV94_9FIRM